MRKERKKQMITGFRGKDIRGNKYFVFVRSWIFDRDILCASFDEWYKVREYARDLADRVEEMRLELTRLIRRM